jgi:hypothetical protein
VTETELNQIAERVMHARVEYYQRHGRFPTKLFLDRPTYLEAIMHKPYAEELNRSRTFLGLELYQTMRFGSDVKPLLLVSE